MALTPLEVQITNDEGAPVEGATIEVRNELTGLTATGYERDGTEMVGPYLTDSYGSKVIWLPNSIVEWRSAGAWVTNWRAFRAYAGYGAEGIFADSLGAPVSLDAPVPAGATLLDTITIPSLGIDSVVGAFALTLDFAFNHMSDLAFLVSTPAVPFKGVWEGADLPNGSTDDYAFDGTVTLGPSGPSAYRDANDDPIEMVDGGTYYHTFDHSDVRTTAADGDWKLYWRSITSPAFSDHLGELRGWSIELIPD